MKKFIAGLAIVAGASTLGVVADATDVLAHVPKVTPSCTGLTISLTQYESDWQGTNNQVSISIDGQPPGGVNFDSSYTPPKFVWSTTQVHSWSVSIDANIHVGNPTQYDVPASAPGFSGSWQPCQQAPTTTTTPPTTSTAVTTTTVAQCAAGAVCDTTTTEPAVTTTVAAPTTTAAVVDTVPVVIGTPRVVLPRTGTPAENNLMLAGALGLAGTILALVARRKRNA